MSKQAFWIGAAVAFGAAATLVSLVLWRRATDRPEDIPDVIEDCFERIRKIEVELSRLHPASEAAA
jgi:hypothetical protein